MEAPFLEAFGLAANAEISDQLTVAHEVLLLKVSEKSTTLSY